MSVIIEILKSVFFKAGSVVEVYLPPDHWATFTSPSREAADMHGNHTAHPTVSINFLLRLERNKKIGEGDLL